MADPSGKLYGVQVGRSVVTRLGGAWTPEKQRFFDAWAKAEGTVANYNPFATTRGGYPGESRFNSVGVKHFPSMAVGIQATYDTLLNGYYDHIVDLLRDPNATAEDLGKAVASSPWGTGTGVLRVLGSKQADAYEAAKSAATYGTLRGQAEQMYKEIEDSPLDPRLQPYSFHFQQQPQINLSPSPGYLAQLSGRSPFGARLAGIAGRFQALVDATPPPTPPPQPQFKPYEPTYTPDGRPMPEQPAPPSDMPTPSAPATPNTDHRFTTAAGSDLSLAVGGVKYNNLGGPEAHAERPLGNWQSDNAYDLGVPVGTPIYAVRDGVVGKNWGTMADRPNDGQRVEIAGVWYGHLSKVSVQPGQTVKRGQLIGYSGQSQNGVPHLHIGFKP